MKRFLFAVFLLFFLSSGAWGKVRIGVVTDTHYKRTGYYSEAANVALEIVDIFNTEDVNIVLHLGDVYDGNFFPDGTEQEKENDYLADKTIYEAMWQNINAPMYWMIGERDISGITDEFFIDNCGYCQKANFTFDLDDWRFICYSNIDGPDYSATVETLIWLENALENARLANKKIIVCTHCRTDQNYPGEPPAYIKDDEPDAYFSFNAYEQRAKINSAVMAGANVKYVFQGHHHTNAHAVIEGIEYYTFKNAGITGSYSVIEIQDDNSLKILGYGEQDSYGITQFYVDGKNGNDDNSGVMRNQAWKTLTHANNKIENGQTVTVLPHTYREDFRPDGGGEDAPKKWIFEPGCRISGAEEFSIWLEDTDENGWYVLENVTTEVDVLLEDDEQLKKGDHTSSAEKGSWDWNENTLYYGPSFGTPGYHIIEGGQRDRGFGIYDATGYLIIEGAD